MLTDLQDKLLLARVKDADEDCTIEYNYSVLEPSTAESVIARDRSGLEEARRIKEAPAEKKARLLQELARNTRTPSYSLLLAGEQVDGFDDDSAARIKDGIVSLLLHERSPDYERIKAAGIYQF